MSKLKKLANDNTCQKCRMGNVIFETIGQVETDGDSITCVITGKCENCDAEHYAVVSGEIDIEVES